jgi:uncharacterized protein involved in type VI secretion and phage assembly
MVVPRSRSTDQRYYGVAEGIVTDVNDPEKEGRVKVQFPWFDQKMESEWCRTRQFYAGNGYGAFFVPEVGDEVLIAFTHGDMRLPIILGGLYNGKDKPPTYRDGTNKDEKLIRTKAGHQLTFVDTKGKESVKLQTQGGHVALFSDDQKQISITSTGGNQVVMDDGNQKISISTAAGQSVAMEDSGTKITIQTTGGDTITMDASGITLQATAKVSIAAPSIELGTGASQQLILGDAFMTLFNAHVHPTAVPGPPSPPATPMLPALLSMITKTA